MQVQEKNIKGFSLLEVIVVMVVIGIISAVSYPPFSSWNNERKVRQDVEKINSIIKNIFVQTERGTFAYVQVKFDNSADNLRVQTKGMTMETLVTKMNDINDIWNTDPTSRCDTISDDYWDTDGSDTDVGDLKNFVYNLTFDEVTSNLIIVSDTGSNTGGSSDTVGGAASSAICFSRNGKFYEADGQFVGPDNAPYGFVYLCRRLESGHVCPVSYGSTINTKEVPSGAFDNLTTIEWSRYGNFSRSRWNSKQNVWFEG